MKRLAIITAAITLFLSGCNCQSDKKDESGQASKAESQDVKKEYAQTVKPVHLTKQTFLEEIVDYEANPNEWIYKGELPSLIDFYADWCRPCKITSPILEELAEEYAGQINIYKVDVQNERELAAVFGVQSIPTFLYIPKNDNPVISSGIANTPEATKIMFREQIDKLLLQK